MVYVKLILASLMIVVLTVNIIDAATPLPNMALNSKPVIVHTDVVVPTININGIDIGQAAPGNSWPVNITLNVTQMGNDICNLSVSDFKVDTLNVPPGGSAIDIKSVTLAPHRNFMYGPSKCNYWVLLVPGTNSDKQNKWVQGNYTLQLEYVKGGKQLAKSIVFGLLNETSYQFERATITMSGNTDNKRKVNIRPK